MRSARSIQVRIAVAALALLAAGTTGAGASGTSAPAATSAACRAQRIVAWLNTQGSGTAGSIYYRVELTNLSARACTLTGYPRVAALGLAGHQLGDASGRFVSRVRTVTLAPRATGSFVLQITNVSNFSAAACRPVTAAGLRVVLPHQTFARRVPFPLRACSRRGPVYLWAQAVVGHP
jgi:Domain of unknown function (DUF4232)